MTMLLSLGMGITAGLALAVPLGAIGVLLIQEGMQRGVRTGFCSASGVALVDGTYCAIALVGGAAAASFVTTLAWWPHTIGGIALITVGTRGLARHGRHLSHAPSRAGVESSGAAARSGWQRFLLFIGLTAVNPTTLVYFVALIPGIALVTRSAWDSVAFGLGVLAASFAWQMTLVVLGATGSAKLGGRFAARATAVGHVVVITLGAALLLTAFFRAFQH